MYFYCIFLNSQIRKKDDAYYEVPLWFSSDSLGIREQAQRFSECGDESDEDRWRNA